MPASDRSVSSLSPNHGAARTVLRVAGFALVAVGGYLTVATMESFFASNVGQGPPTGMWRAFAGVAMLGLGVTCLKLGFLRTITRYLAAQTAPVVSDALDHVTQRARGEAAGSAKGQRRCPSCEVEQRAGARFCDRCGRALSA
jgi:hypothetical protein